MRALILLLFATALLANEQLVSGNQAYDKADYQAAEKIYQAEKMSSGEKFYNLGSIYYRKGEIGRSIYYLKRAKELLPRDGDVDFNLTYLRNKALDKIEKKKEVNLLSFKGFLNARESLILVSLSAFLFWILSIVYLYKKGEVLLWTKRAFLTLFIVSAFVTAKDWMIKKDFGVIVNSKVNVYSAIGRDNVVLFTLHEGAEFIYEESTDEWVQIVLDDGKKGWVKKEHVLI